MTNVGEGKSFKKRLLIDLLTLCRSRFELSVSSEQSVRLRPKKIKLGYQLGEQIQ